MNCETFTGLMGDYRENDLDEETVVLFDAHRSICLNCSRLFASYNETIRIVHSLPCCDIPPEALRRIRSNLKSKIGHLSDYQ